MRSKVTVVKVNKSAAIEAAEAALVKVEASVQDFESKLLEWRDTAPDKFLQAVHKYYESDTRYNFSVMDFTPPKQSDLCTDYRVNSLRRAIARLKVTNPYKDGSVHLSSDDTIFTYLGVEDCL